jgi:cyanophycinase
MFAQETKTELAVMASTKNHVKEEQPALKGNECPVPNGILLIIGGKENKGEDPEEETKQEDYAPMEILKTFIDLINHKAPVIEVVTTASSEGAESFADYKKVFEKLGVQNIGHIHHNARKEAMQDDLIPRVKAAHGFFFGGGDQLLLTSLYGGSPFLTALKERYIRDKIVVAGTSAGAMALSTPMIYAGAKEVQQISGEIKITTGLEFLKDVCIDTHFVNRSRLVRLAQVIATNPSAIGIGIEEDTAVILRDGLKAEIIGSGTVIVVDGSEIEAANVTHIGNQERIAIRNLRVHILSKGETYTIPQTNPPHI